MLQILHRQTTAYHPESQGCPSRTLRSDEELPFVLLGLRTQLREDTSLSPAEADFGTPIFLSNEFLQGDEFSVDSIVKIFF
jgi:hypothetical protein